MATLNEHRVSVCCHEVELRYWDSPIDITDDLRESLIEQGEQRAKTCIIDGCRSGDLSGFVPDTGDSLRGWWEIVTD